MRRWLALFLLLLLPFQFSWSAVAAYCGHETEAASGHLGHHEHQHRLAHPHTQQPAHEAEPLPDRQPLQLLQLADAGVEAADSGPGTAAGIDHLDCGQCHGHGNGLPTFSGSRAFGPPALPCCPTADAAGSTGLPTRPERPQWAGLA